MMSPDSIEVPAAYCRLRVGRDWPNAPMTIYPCSEIASSQVGYRCDAHGQGLAGWKREWLVVGHDEFLGDPIFLDIGTPMLRAYTADHGQGNWDPLLIAGSAAILLDSVDLIDSVWGKRLDPESARQALKKLHADPGEDLEFWDGFLVVFPNE